MSAPAFELPPVLEAGEPPESRGLARDQVRLMVVHRAGDRVTHARFRELPRHLAAGDLLVLNVSATRPAAIAARREDFTQLELHFATEAPDAPSGEWWVVELRTPGGAAPFGTARAGEVLTLIGGATVTIAAPYTQGARLWLAEVDAGEPVSDHLARHGHAIRYAYARSEWPLEAYQTVYATESGSAEMPSAGRPFTPEVITALVARGVLVAPVTLHTGVSSPERHERPHPERFRVPEATARLVNAVRSWGGRVVAVGTTVIRALETAAADDGTVSPADGWTNLVVTPERGLRAVDGLLTGWHEPSASHMQILEAAAGARLLEHSYRAALAHGYRWHEFGDSHLILP